MEKDSSVTPMATLTLAVLARGEHTARVFTLGVTGRFTTASGTKGSSMATVSGEALTTTHTLGSGVTPRPRDTECTLGKTGTGTKASGNSV